MRSLAKSALRQLGIERHHVAAMRMGCERHALATFRRNRARQGGRILCYHSVGQPVFGVNDVSPALMRRQIEIALKAGYRFRPAAEIAADGGGPKDLAITFDDGCKSLLTDALPILRDHGIPWTVFVVADWADQRDDWTREQILSWRDVETLLAAGVEIGSHSMTHPDFGRLGAEETAHELHRSRQIIADRLGFAPAAFAIPFGQSMNWTAHARQVANEAGYEIIYAQAEETRPEGTVPRTFVTRFDTDRIFAALLGGAYDRWEEWV